MLTPYSLQRFGNEKFDFEIDLSLGKTPIILMPNLFELDNRCSKQKYPISFPPMKITLFTNHKSKAKKTPDWKIYFRANKPIGRKF